MFHRQFYVRHTVWYKWKSCRTCQSFAWFVWQVLQLTTTYTVNAFSGTIFLIIQLLRLCSTGMEWSHLSRAMTKPTMWLCAQQRLRSAWASAQSSLSTWRKLGSLATHWVHSEDSDQTGRMPRLIWVFTGRTLILLVLSCCGSFQFVSFILFFVVVFIGIFGPSQLLNFFWASGAKMEDPQEKTTCPPASRFWHVRGGLKLTVVRWRLIRSAKD